MRKRRVHHELQELLASGRLQDFTLLELKKAYQTLPGSEHSSDRALRQFLSRTLARLEKAGLVASFPPATGGKKRFRWVGSNALPTWVAATDSKVAVTEVPMTVSRLKEKLHHYKVEMLSAIGETEEYDAVCAELPHMRGSVQSLYNEARDRCSKMLGRVKALESILANQINLQQS